MTTAKIWRFVAQIPLIKRTASCLFDDYFQHLSVGELTLDVTGTTSYIGELERWRNDLHVCGGGCNLLVAGCRLQVAGCRLQVAGCRLQVAGCRLY